MLSLPTIRILMYRNVGMMLDKAEPVEVQKLKKLSLEVILRFLLIRSQKLNRCQH
jgi:hypothetical protein